MSFTTAISNLTRAETLLLARDLPEDVLGDDEWSTQTLEGAVSELLEAMEGVPVSRGTKAVAEEVKRHTKLFSPSVPDARIAARTSLENLKKALISDLTGPLCLMIEQGTARALYETPVEYFGKDIIEEFPEAKRDIEAGSMCLALGQHTASVFHMMRVAERGIRRMADKLNVTFPQKPIEYQRWHNILEKIDSAIKTKRQAPNKATKQDELQRLSDVASQFWHFKDAWRNHVSHARSMYDKASATEIYTAVASLMRKLASLYGGSSSSSSSSLP